MSFAPRFLPSLAAVSTAVALAAPREARAEPGFSFSPGIVLAGSFGDKITFGLGVDLRLTVLPQSSPCSREPRAGAGPFVQAVWLNFSKAGRFAIGAHGGGDLARQLYALDGELGWTYRTRVDDSEGGQGVHFGIAQSIVVGALPSPEVAARATVSWFGPRIVPEGTVSFTGRWPGVFGMSASCISGRPLRVDGEVVLPDTVVVGARPARRIHADDAARAAIAAGWLDDARAECASVPAFLALARDLAAVGAPPGLVEGALAAARDEARHAALCSDMAGALSGVIALPLLLAPPAARAADRAGVLARLALESWEDGCLGEGAAAGRARRALAAATDPAAAGALATIARDEQRHADLAWRVLAYCLEAAPGLRDRLADRMLGEAADPPAAERLHGDVTAARALGRLAPADADAAWDENRATARRRADRLLGA